MTTWRVTSFLPFSPLYTFVVSFLPTSSSWTWTKLQIAALKENSAALAANVIKRCHQNHTLETLNDNCSSCLSVPVNPVLFQSEWAALDGAIIGKFINSFALNATITELFLNNKWKLSMSQSLYIHPSLIKTTQRLYLSSFARMSWGSTNQCFEVRVRVEETRKICGSMLLNW